MRFALALVVAALFAGRAHAQSPYVGASFVADVVRVSGASAGLGSGSGEAFGGALRLGAPLGDRWGVEIELARTGEIDAAPPIAILAQAELTFGLGGPIPQIFPPPRIESERQLTTISTLLWWDYPITSRVSLAYLGGVSFTRTAAELRIAYPAVMRPPDVLGGIGLPRTLEHETVGYDADVVVGFEGRIGMTDHLRLVPGVRLQTIAEGWAFRPAVGLQWIF